MKKIFTLFMSGMVAVSALAQSKANPTSDANTIKNAFYSGSDQTVYIKAPANGSAINLKKFTPNNAGNLHFIGVPDSLGHLPEIDFEITIPSNTDENRYSWTFENLALGTTYVSTFATNNSKYHFSYKDSAAHYMDTLAFINCEITNIARGFWRAQNLSTKTGNDGAGGYVDGGAINTVRVEGCTFHNAPQNTLFSIFYMGQRVSEMVFRNNTIYDIPQMNSLVAFGFMESESLREDLNFTFENNTVVVGSKSRIFDFGSNVGQMSEVHINNNFFLYPDYTSAWAQEKAVNDSIVNSNFGKQGIVRIAFAGGGIEVKNNVLYGYIYGIDDPLDADKQATWTSDPDSSSLTMADVNMTWNTFTDAPNGLFYIYNKEKVYTAGVDGCPIGDTTNYTNVEYKVVTLDIQAEGSKSAILSASPSSASYLSGEVVRVSYNTRGLSDFLGWTVNGKDAGMDNPIELTLTENTVLVGKFQEHDYLAVFDFTNRGKDTKDAPYYSEVFTTDSALQINYRTWDVATSAYADTVTSAVYSRSDKFSKPCIVVRTQNLYNNQHPDYLYITVPALEAGAKITSAIGTDNFIYSKTNIDVREVGAAEWTNIGSVQLNPDTVKYEITSFHVNNPTIFTDASGNPYEATNYFESNTWHPVSADIPAKFAGKAIEIRFMGDATSAPFMAADQYGNMKVQYANNVYDSEDPYTAKKIEDGTAYFSGKEYLYISAIEIDGKLSGAAAISEIAADGQNSGRMYDLLGRQVNGAKAGLFIQNGKVVMVR